MNSLTLAAAISLGVVASTSFAASADQNAWQLDVSGGAVSGKDSNLVQVSVISEDGNQIEWPMAAAQGFPNGWGSTAGEDPKNPGDSDEVNGDPDGGESLPAVPLPAPLLMAACGLVAVVIGRNQLSKLVGR